ncbi:MAG: hypothetical protein R2911_10800 [Caldilineaceae bacterium]
MKSPRWVWTLSQKNPALAVGQPVTVNPLDYAEPGDEFVQRGLPHVSPTQAGGRTGPAPMLNMCHSGQAGLAAAGRAVAAQRR